MSNATFVQAEVDEKVRLIEVYNERLTEREARRETVVKQGLFHQKRYQACFPFGTLDLSSFL